MDNLKDVIRQKMRFIVPVTLFFMMFYFLLPLSISLFPQVMSTPVYHFFNLGWVLAFAQFIMTWGIGWLYLRKAKQFDRMIDELFNEKEQT